MRSAIYNFFIYICSSVNCNLLIILSLLLLYYPFNYDTIIAQFLLFTILGESK